MLKLSRLVFLPLALLAASAMAQTEAAPQEVSVSLKRTPKVGEELRYKVETTIFGEIDSILTSTSVLKVTEVAEAGTFSVEEKILGAKLKVGEIDQTLPDSKQTSVYDLFNRLVDVKGDDVNDKTKPYFFRLNAMQALVASDKAVKVGDTWTIEYKADPSNGNVGSQVDYTADGMEKVGRYDCIRIKALSKQVGGDSTGDLRFWVNVADGTLVKQTAVVRKARYPNVSVPLDFSLTLTREDV